MRKLCILLAAAAPLGAQQAPPVRLIDLPTASSKPVLGLPAAVRALPGGRLLVNDIQKRQLLMFDPTLASFTVVADSIVGGSNAYGPGAGAIIPYFADSTLFVDPRDLSMFIIDPNGAISRVAAVPRSQDAGSLGSNLLGSPALDSKGRIVYRGGIGLRMMPAPAKNGTGFTMPEMPDSSAIVRVDLTTRKVDTAAYYKITKTKMNMVQNEKGMTMTSEINPMQTLDDWAVTDDGTIAIIRGRDYHIDWVDADNHVTSTGKIPFDWQRLSDEDKAAVIDSAKAAMEAQRAKAVAGGGGPMAAGAGGGPVTITSFSISGGGGGGGDGSVARRGAETALGGLGAMPPLNFVAPSELPDYRPAINAGSAKADMDGNLWIRTSATRKGAVAGPIYDVVNRKGELVDRVQIPAGRQIIGFGKGGVVFMLARDDKGAWIERTTAGPKTRS